MFKRKLAEVVIFSVIGALIAPVVASFLANLIFDKVSEVYVVPMAAIAILILSFLISTFIKWGLASQMSINMNHITVVLAIFILQFLICSVFVWFGMTFIYATAVIMGSFFSLVITVITRPFTAAIEIKEMIEEKQKSSKSGNGKKNKKR